MSAEPLIRIYCVDCGCGFKTGEIWYTDYDGNRHHADSWFCTAEYHSPICACESCKHAENCTCDDCRRADYDDNEQPHLSRA